MGRAAPCFLSWPKCNLSGFLEKESVPFHSDRPTPEEPLESGYLTPELYLKWHKIEKRLLELTSLVEESRIQQGSVT